MAANPWTDYVGRSREAVEQISSGQVSGLAALLDHPGSAPAGAASPPWSAASLPPFCHWLNANVPVAQSGLGADGHPRTGDFIPAIPLSRRMWAGSRVQCPGDIASAQAVRHRQTIKSIQPKRGRSGEMIFVTVLHEYYVGQQRVLLEEQDLVYRGPTAVPLQRPAARPLEQVLAAQAYDWQRSLRPDPVLLFRYSAVSFNSHRIHYDRDYATAEEGYPALVVQGPLTATLLLDLYTRNNPDQRIASFEFRGLQPLYEGSELHLLGRQTAEGASLWALDAQGEMAMQLDVTATRP